MNEEKARTRWCPHGALEKSLRMHTITACAIAKPSSKSILNDASELAANKDQKCIASDCMMWQEYKYFETPDGRHFVKRLLMAANGKKKGIVGL